MFIASLAISPPAFAMERTARLAPEVEIEAERIAAHSSEWVMPCLWLTGLQGDRAEELIESDPSVDEIVEREHFDEGEAYYQVAWDEAVEERINAYIDKEGSILEARLQDGTWRVDIRFVSRDQFDEFRKRLTEGGYSFQLLNLNEVETPHQGYRKLTRAQRDALVVAARNGYFRVPRETTMERLAAELDIAHQSVSELLRRGTENLVFSMLTVDEEADE